MTAIVAAIVLCRYCFTLLAKPIYLKGLYYLKLKQLKKVCNVSGNEHLLGNQALTTLRPAGTALIDGERVDVVTDGEYLPNDTEIKVVKVEGARIVVEKNK